jgi:hypothetical protein
MFVVVDTYTKCKVRHPRTRKETYASERAARAAVTRISKIQDTLGSFVVMEVDAYRAQVPMREVTNLLTGETVQERADTPWSCSVASESYWSS